MLAAYKMESVSIKDPNISKIMSVDRIQKTW